MTPEDRIAMSMRIPPAILGEPPRRPAWEMFLDLFSPRERRALRLTTEEQEFDYWRRGTWT